jgi:hypothetical protein
MRRSHLRGVRALICGLAALLIFQCWGNAQNALSERKFAQPKSEVENAIKQVQPTSGRLPALDGFARPGDRPLDRFQRGYYQCTLQVSSTPSGGSVVRVSAKITAWYADPTSAKSGYEVLPSNGRLETDLLDRIEESLGGKASSIVSQPGNQALDSTLVPATPMPNGSFSAKSAIASPLPNAPAGLPFKVEHGADSDRIASLLTQKAVADKRMDELTHEAKNLAEIQRNQAHPTNLAAVKKSATPVLTNPIEGAKILFLATAEDEFEILDQSANWVHVRIAGLSRGWIRRSSLELPDPTAAPAKTESGPAAVAVPAESFGLKDEQTATFPGSWEPLRGKTVRILTVQETAVNATNTGPLVKLGLTKSLFEKKYADLGQAATSTEGVVVIFDSEDGGMAAATVVALRQWKSGALSDQAFWRRCFFDPPEAFGFQGGK